jgi:hypothetical protein
MLYVVLIASLTMAALYLARRWSESKAENAGLRAQIASLKRQLGVHGRAR